MFVLFYQWTIMHGIFIYFHQDYYTYIYSNDLLLFLNTIKNIYGAYFICFYGYIQTSYTAIVK